MSSTASTSYETVLPRPAEPLPIPAVATATRKLADKLSDQFGMTDEAASAFAQATVDPSSARRAAEQPERLPVPGGVVIGVRTEVWARNVMPDPRNPRIGPARRHAASALIGRDETTRFRPIPEPEASPGGAPELRVQLQSQEQLAWAAKQARDYVVEQNDWRDSIRSQGVMTEVWLAAVRFSLGNETNVTVPVTSEGSSRVTAVHDLLGVRSADVPFTRENNKLRAHIRGLNDALSTAGSPDQLDSKTATFLRCEKLPALLLVGFEPHAGANPDFSVAVKSLVALRHVDYPKPWGEATENEALADAAVAELERRGVITSGMADWLIGTLTPLEALNNGLSDDPLVRAAAIARVFTDRSIQTHEAIRVAITSQSTRKNITTKLLLDIATSLILRSVTEQDGRRRERIRKYLKDAYSVELARDWQATFRSADEVKTEALKELAHGEPGPASRELAARSAYALIVDGRLTGDRGTKNNDQPDRRRPGEVIDRMRGMDHGILQLHQAVTDFAAGRRIRAVDEQGTVMRNDEGLDVVLRDADLRRTFYPVGERPPVPAPQNTAEQLHNELAALGIAVRAVSDAVKAVEALQADDGSAAIDFLGADPGDCTEWSRVLFEVVQRLPVWSGRYSARNGMPQDADDLDDDLDDDEDPLDFDEDEEVAADEDL